MNIQPIYKFNPILKLHINNSYNIQSQLDQYMPIKWQLLLMNNGSFTQNLNTLLVTNIKIDMCQKYNLIPNKSLTNIRLVWLKKNIQDKFTFAHSIWRFDQSYNQQTNLLTNKPVGQSFIDNEIDLHKDFQEIYYGYCYYLEKQFKSSEPIWARKYKVCYNNNSYAIIEEFFSPQLIHCFNVNDKLINQ